MVERGNGLTGRALPNGTIKSARAHRCARFARVLRRDLPILRAFRIPPVEPRPA